MAYLSDKPDIGFHGMYNGSRNVQYKLNICQHACEHESYARILYFAERMVLSPPHDGAEC